MTTLLLTSEDPALPAALRRLRPGWTVQPLGADPPREVLAGPVMAFVDWLMPELSGLEMVRRLRENAATRSAHVTLVLDDADADSRRRALAAGADDYVTGPVRAETIIARVEAAPAAPTPARLALDGLSIDLAAHQVRHDGRAVPLRPNEFRLLVHFARNPDQVFSRRALIDRLGKDEGVIDERTVDVWVGRLRRSLKAHGVADPLRTVRSLGYVLDSPTG